MSNTTYAAIAGNQLEEFNKAIEELKKCLADINVDLGVILSFNFQQVLYDDNEIEMVNISDSNKGETIGTLEFKNGEVVNFRYWG